MMQSELSRTHIYDELIRMIDEVRFAMKDLKEFYRKNKKEAINSEALAQKWCTIILRLAGRTRSRRWQRA